MDNFTLYLVVVFFALFSTLICLTADKLIETVIDIIHSFWTTTSISLSSLPLYKLLKYNEANLLYTKSLNNTRDKEETP